MSDYLFLFRGGEQPKAPEAMQKHMQKWMSWIKDLTAKGTFKGGEPLESNGKVVRGRNKTVTDGPFAEAKDLVGGYFLISARDLDEATEISKGCPSLEIDGAVEVRPVRLIQM